MSKPIVLLLSALLLTQPLFANDLPGDADLARFGSELLRIAGANDRVERAAFIVLTNEGTFELHPWKGAGFFSARWRGKVPDGVVAVIHTHPKARPTPSEQDREEAMRTGLPFYVVSRTGLCMSDPAGNVSCARSIPWLQRKNAGTEIALNWTEARTGLS